MLRGGGVERLKVVITMFELRWVEGGKRMKKVMF